MRVGVIGAGSWGTTVASLAAHNTDTLLWSRQPDVVDAINTQHQNRRYLDGFDLHPNLRCSLDLFDVAASADVIVMAVPSHGFRETLESIGDKIRPWVPIVSLTKGLEQGTMMRMTEVAEDILPGHPAGALTGPNLAKEVLDGHAAASVVAMTDDHIAKELQRIFTTPNFMAFTNDDITGCEIGGALKNVYAIASGMADGMGTGDNTRSAIVTRGLAELTQLGVAIGGRAETFAGLAGMGDLIATCVSSQSRNRFVGERLGQGKTVDEIIEEMDQVAEGIKTTAVVMTVAEAYGIDMPIASEVYNCVYEGQSAADAYANLMSRRAGRELPSRK